MQDLNNFLINTKRQSFLEAYEKAKQNFNRNRKKKLMRSTTKSTLKRD